MTEEQLNKILDKQFAKFAGQIMRHVDQRVDAVQDELKTGIDGIRVTVNGIAKRLDDDRTEQVILNHHYEGWIGQLAETTSTKLVPEQ